MQLMATMITMENGDTDIDSALTTVVIEANVIPILTVVIVNRFNVSLFPEVVLISSATTLSDLHALKK